MVKAIHNKQEKQKYHHFIANRHEIKELKAIHNSGVALF